MPKAKIVLELSPARARGLFEILDTHIDPAWSDRPEYKHYAAVWKELHQKLFGTDPDA